MPSLCPVGSHSRCSCKDITKPDSAKPQLHPLANFHPAKASLSAFLFLSWAASYCWSDSETGVDRLFYKSALLNLNLTSLVFNNPFIIAYDSGSVQYGYFSSGLSLGLNSSFLANDAIRYINGTAEALIFLSLLLYTHSFSSLVSQRKNLSSALPLSFHLFSFTLFSVTFLASCWLICTPLDLDQ